MRDFLRSITPKIMLIWFRRYKRSKMRKHLSKEKLKGNTVSKDQILAQLQNAGIEKGDTLLVHCSMSKIGFLENGPDTLIDGLLEQIGPEGNLMMPSSPNASLQIEHVKSNPVFDVLETPSKLGAVSECFRKKEGVLRSWHPTEPVCALGPDKNYLISGHFKAITPYTTDSPFSRLYEKAGKILYIGVTLDNAGTNLHTLEDAIEFEYPIYDAQNFEVTIIDPNGNSHKVVTKVHNPKWSAKRKCDNLLPFFLNEKVYQKYPIGKAETLVFDGKKMFDAMIKAYREKGITMYHPEGKK